MTSSLPPEHGSIIKIRTSGSTAEPITTYGTSITKFFWDVFSGRLLLYQLPDYEVVKLYNLLEIIWFINPKGVQKLLSTICGIKDMQYVYQRSSASKYWVHSRHKGYYLWIIFGW